MYIENTLCLSGWFKGRNVDISNDKRCLAKDKYQLTSIVECFLHEYSGLTIKFTTPSNDLDFFHFNVCKAVQDLDSRWVYEDYIKRISTLKICPIGQAYSNHLTLFMDELGYLYGGYDDYFCLISNNENEVIEALINKKMITEIP